MAKRPPLVTVTIGLVAGVVIIVSAFAVGRLSTPSAAIPTPTAVSATPTPNLVVKSPQIIGSYMLTSIPTGPCPGCSLLNFVAKGPFALLVACQSTPGDAGDTYQIDVVNGGGHVLDSIHKDCGGTGDYAVRSAVIPESLSAGTYQLQVTSNVPITVLVLDASGV